MAKKKSKEYLQLDLIPPTETEKLYAEFKQVKDSSDKVRRGIFAKHSDLAKRIEELTCQIESLQRQIIVLSEWAITRLGYVMLAPQKPEEFGQPITLLHGTKIIVTYAQIEHRLHPHEIMDTQSLSA